MSNAAAEGSFEDQHITCTDDMNNLNITCSEVEVVGVCACCGKEGSDMNICNKCKDTKYCNATCKKKHRKRHKNKCERRVAELHDIELFKQPPQPEDCPICFMPLPSLETGTTYKVCCGKKICSGCIHAVRSRNNGVSLCPFCRTVHSDEEIIERYKKRIEVGDAHAMFNLGCCYSKEGYGLRQDRTKAFELWHKAGELGIAKAYYNIGNMYYFGRGVERDDKKANHYYELAAMGGCVVKARHNLGCSEAHAGNWDRALKHWMISAGSGHNNSVKMIQKLYMKGHASKETYTSALRAYQSYLDEVRSEQRDKAAAAYSDRYKYY